MVLADTRGLTAGDHLETFEEIQMVWGCKHYLKLGGQEINGYYIDGQPLAGLFDEEKEGVEAQLFRERIHLLGIVSEKTFGEDQVIQQTHLYRNHFLPDSKLASTAFPLAGKHI